MYRLGLVTRTAAWFSFVSLCDLTKLGRCLILDCRVRSVDLHFHPPDSQLALVEPTGVNKPRILSKFGN